MAEKAESNSGWLFPVGDELNELGYNHMFMDMFNSMENGTAPKETFYDGYVVNAILDAAYKSVKTKLWEPVNLIIWRGKTGLSKDNHLIEYDADHYLVKEEITHYGAKKLILKNNWRAISLLLASLERESIHESYCPKDLPSYFSIDFQFKIFSIIFPVFLFFKISFFAP